VTAIRQAEELAGVPDPAWPEWLELLRLAPIPAAVLPVARQAGLEVLFRLQITARACRTWPPRMTWGRRAPQGRRRG
jgi:hypothetical protein